MHGLGWTGALVRTTLKIAKDIAVSGAVTLIMAAAFSGSSARHEPQPSAPALPTFTAAAGPSATDWLKISFDPALVQPRAFAHPAAVPRLHRAAARTADVPLPPPRPAPAKEPRIIMATLPEPPPSPTIEPSEAPASLPLADEPPSYRPFRVFGIRPGDLLPSPLGIYRRVGAVGSSIAALAARL